jgi:hypothetical protein
VTWGEKALTALATIDPPGPSARERLILAAVEWVFNQSCSAALAELEEAAQDYVGRNTDGSVRVPG